MQVVMVRFRGPILDSLVQNEMEMLVSVEVGIQIEEKNMY